jgi:hypothetical protein
MICEIDSEQSNELSLFEKHPATCVLLQGKRRWEIGVDPKTAGAITPRVDLNSTGLTGRI